VTQAQQDFIGYFLSDAAPWVFLACVYWLVIRARRRRAAAEAKDRAHVATMMRLAWMLVSERPSKVVYWTDAEVDATPDQPHLIMELTPNGYALKARTEPLDHPAAHGIVLG